jgi:hypothetical protein
MVTPPQHPRNICRNMVDIRIRLCLCGSAAFLLFQNLDGIG